MPIRAVLWDVDDTLFDYAGSDRTGALRHIEAEGLLARHPSPEAALERWQVVMDEQFARFLSRELSFPDHRRERARQFLGEPLTDAAADEWFGRYVALYEEAWTLFADAVPALDALTPAYRHGILSNSAVRNQDRKLTRLGIRDRFEVLRCADELGCAKPDAAAFHATCAALGLPPEQVAYVGDHPDLDARGAEAAGLLGIWLDRSGAGERARAGDAAGGGDPAGGSHPAGGGDGLRRITGLAELPRLLRAYEAGTGRQ
ncbi:HAD family hydrolase [Streptomyces armeniacus]|uniref:HAD family hydrolase n=1 Tax=Streptomyces armeniacus TaxID=83291 RepID=A0A345XWR2_9ACTN|nr:HAD family hydrolase [Streptomyces armeniacus]AXK36078.1 HAD family hydrolase [Streptomyces armeniacus]